MYEERKNAFIETIKNSSIGTPFIEELPNPTYPPQPQLKKQFSSILKKAPKPCGFLGLSDNLAVGFMESARSLGYEIPKDFAILGIDNNDLFCDSSDIPISSVDNDQEGLGEHAAMVLAKLMKKQSIKKELNPLDTFENCIRHPPKGVHARQSSEIFSSSHPIITEALQIIEKSLHKKINASQLADKLNMTPQTLQSIFREYYICAPAKAIRNMQIKEAKHLLYTRKASLKEVADKCGFGSVDSLCRSFKRETGTTPASWRKGSSG